MIPLIYVAGPYTAPTRQEREINTSEANDMGRLLVAEGCYPIIPHQTGLQFENERSDEPWWRAATLEALKVCHACVVVGEWNESEGTIGELAWCHENWFPTFEAQGSGLPLEFYQWVDAWRKMSREVEA